MGASGAGGGASGRGEERTDSAKAKIKAATQMVAGQSLITGKRSISAILPARSSPKHLLSGAGDATDRVEPREAGTPEAQLNYPSRPGVPGLAPSGRSIGVGKTVENVRTPARHWASARGRLAGVDRRSCASRSEQRPS